jgi:probable F420-dependent oxidoreductase
LIIRTPDLVYSPVVAGTPHSFEFGAEMLEPFDGMTWTDSAREVEALGYSTLFAGDHFDEGLGPIVSMATAATATTKLRVATAVFCTDFRHPAVLARELASIDQLSAGRLEVGLGAGYQVNDYRSSGIAMDPPKVRVDRLIEYVAVLRGLFADGPFSFAGEHFQIAELEGTPHPHTPGGPPIFVAGGGPRMLRFAARHADIVGVNRSLPKKVGQTQVPLEEAGAGQIDEKFALIREAAGARYDDLTFHGWLQVTQVTNDGRGAAAKLAERYGLDVEDFLALPFFLVGSVDEIVERLHERRERWGYSYYTIQGPTAHEFAPVLQALAGY